MLVGEQVAGSFLVYERRAGGHRLGGGEDAGQLLVFHPDEGLRPFERLTGSSAGDERDRVPEGSG